MLYGRAMRNPRSILITGASSGLGAALALIYAATGTRLVLCGRDPVRLAAIATACRDSGAAVEEAVFDVTDAEATRIAVEAADDLGPLDLVIANAGISGGTAGGGETREQMRAILAVNLDGVVNTAHPAAARMESRGRGQIALMSSLAGFRGLPGAPAYSTSKVAVRAWGDAMRGRLAPRGVTVSIVCPGFVRTPLTDANRFAMPFLMEPEPAARIIRDGLARGRTLIGFPWQTYLAIRLIAALPPFLADPLLGRMPEKG